MIESALAHEEARTEEAGSGGDLALLLGIDDAAALLGIGRTNTYSLMTEGRIRWVKIGTRRLIPRVELEEFVERLMRTSWSSGE